MGHHGPIKQEHLALVRRLNAGQVGLPEPRDPKAWQAWKDLLELFYSPEDAELAAKMPLRPSSIHAVAASVGIGVEALKPRLEAMCDRGLVMDLVHPRTGKVRYFLSPPVVGFFEFSLMRVKDMYPKKRMAEALEAYMHGDRAFAEDAFGGATTIGRALAREEQLDEELVSDVLTYQRAADLIRDARAVSVGICYCRHQAEHLGRQCDAPVRNCLSLNSGAEFIARRGFGRAIGASEALELLAEAKQAGLVQIADNVQRRPIYVCNCCGCCCGQLRAINEYGLAAVRPSGFVPRPREDKCKGCARCARACPIGAIAMTPRRQAARRGNELRPRVDCERCLGCGVCSAACRRHALPLGDSGEKPYVPLTVIERMTRMSIERGRLAHLLFDQGSSRGHHFLNRVVQTLMKLPAADRLAASEQVTSRFVKRALAQLKDPTGD